MNELLASISGQGNWIDLVVIGIIVMYLQGNKGFIASIIDVAGFIVSLVIAYAFNTFLGIFIHQQFELPVGISNALGFFILWFLSEAIIYSAFTILRKRYFRHIERSGWNYWLGLIPAGFHALLLCVFVSGIIFSFPVRGWIKEDVMNSFFGPTFMTVSMRFEKNIKRVFGDAVQETMNFMTVKTTSDSTVELDFTLEENELSVDQESEEIMRGLVNEERKKVGQAILSNDNDLQIVARDYAEEMMIHGFFSHTSAVDGSSVGDRVQRNDIDFYIVGENLAYAPDVFIAHTGLMNSDGHRANILSEDYTRVGIGIIDGGFYGQMFVQVFGD